MNVNKGKVVVREKFLRPEFFLDGIYQNFATLTLILKKKFLDGRKRNVSYRFAHKFSHSFLIKILQTVLESKIIVRAEFELKVHFVIKIFVRLVNKFANEKSEKNIKSAFLI